jgi:RimJ/RimL family protein N-acetyltransferase
MLPTAVERLGHGHVIGRRRAHAERGGDRAAVDGERVVRAVLALRKGGRARCEEGDGRSSEGPSEETHIPNNVAGGAIVAIRPMRREDVDAFAGWSRHDDPLFRHYNVPAMTPGDADDLWRMLTADPAVRRPYAGLAGERVVATLMLRNIDPETAGGELGIMLDPACLGQGMGRRILAAFVAVLEADGFRRVYLEVAGYNERAIAAYRAAGFTTSDEYWVEPEPGLDIASLLDGPAAGIVRPNVRREPDGSYRTRIVRMERRLTTQSKDNVPL